MSAGVSVEETPVTCVSWESGADSRTARTAARSGPRPGLQSLRKTFTHASANTMKVSASLLNQRVNMVKKYGCLSCLTSGWKKKSHDGIWEWGRAREREREREEEQGALKKHCVLCWQALQSNPLAVQRCCFFFLFSFFFFLESLPLRSYFQMRRKLEEGPPPNNPRIVRD